MQKTKSIALILGVITMSFLVGYLILAAWTEPTTSPPGGNVAAPLNTSINAQSKEGALVVGANPSVGTTSLIVLNGNVGIGTTNPSSILEVNTGQSSKLRITTTPAGQAGNYTVNWNALEICQFGTCCPPWIDCDGDGKTYQAKTDCDEGCATCYVGSTFASTSADGRDQDCNGKVDDVQAGCVWGYDSSCNWVCGGHYMDPRSSGYCPSGYTQSTYGVNFWTTGDSVTCGGHAWWGQGSGGTSYTGYTCQHDAYW